MALSFGFAFLFEGADFDLRQQRNPVLSKLLF
jgi:hypothetical protein